jgi:hypothetical protein
MITPGEGGVMEKKDAVVESKPTVKSSYLPHTHRTQGFVIPTAELDPGFNLRQFYQCLLPSLEKKTVKEAKCLPDNAKLQRWID